MANVTDPLAANLHGTDPQNLMEYITRQKIYDTRYWKEECFGLTAVDVLEKSSHLKCIGSSYGGNAKPTKFLCLILKMLQIQPDDEIVDEMILQENFKYVRAIGAFYKRLTGRPAEIYEVLEPLYRDYRKLRMRRTTDWAIEHMDEFIHMLLTEERVCGIALPRLPQRSVLIEAGYLEEGPRVTGLVDAMDGEGPRAYLKKKVEQGNEGARLLEHKYIEMANKNKKKKQKHVDEKKKRKRTFEKSNEHDSGNDDSYRGYYTRPLESQKHDTGNNADRNDGRGNPDAASGNNDRAENHNMKQQRGSNDQSKKYGSLFSDKKTKIETSQRSSQSESKPDKPPEEGSDEYWDEQRAKLGLKPLRR